MAPLKIDKLPVIGYLIKWFKTDDPVIDNDLFRLHHQATTFFLMFGLIVIYIENHLDGKSITCNNGADNYAKAYCWLHGTGYLQPHLQGLATGCYIDQRRLADPAHAQEDARVTAYYLWLPSLLLSCFALARMPRMLWRRYLERGMLKAILANKNSAKSIADAFIEWRPWFNSYQRRFAFCEALNVVSVLASALIANTLLRGKFLAYGPEVMEYYLSSSQEGEAVQLHKTARQPQWYSEQLQEPLLHNPMCELFPTEVACHIQVGALTGGVDRNNYLCILSNNLFNQAYFLFLWFWWALLLLLSFFGLIYRFTRVCVPSLSLKALGRKLRPTAQVSLYSLQLTSSGDYFVLQRIIRNLPPHMADKVLAELAKKVAHDKETTSNEKTALLTAEGEQV